MAVITVARQIGSGGDLLAGQVAQILGYECVDRRLVEEIAAITDTTPEEVERFDEKGEGRVKHFLKRLLVPQLSPGGFPLSPSAYFPEFGLEFPYVIERHGRQTAGLDQGTYQLLITTLVQDFGTTGRAVIVGRASQAILANHPQVIHLKVVAPLEQRCARIASARRVDLETARQLAEEHDRWRQLYLRNYYDLDWDDPLLYHATINTGRLEIEDAADLVVRYVVQQS